MGILIGTRQRRWRSENTETPDPKDQVKLRLWLIRLAVLLVFGALTAQLVHLQLMNGSRYEERAELNQLRVESVLPSRGLIYDRNGNVVVENVPSFSAAVVAADVPEGRTLEIAAGLQRLLGADPVETTKQIEESRKSIDPFRPIVVKEGLDQATAFRVREELPAIPGVQVVVEPVRRYTQADILSAILGYTGRVDEEDYATLQNEGYLRTDRVGKAGVEAAYEDYLRGKPGTRSVEKDASGREIQTLSEAAAVPGNDLYLSIDLDLQKKVTELTQAAAKGGEAAAIVMDVHTGEILCMVSLPMYDNNVFSGKIDETRLDQYLKDPKKPLINHALAEQYAPGSIFKQITGAAALQEGVATPNTTITSNGFINVPNQYDPSIVYTFRDWAVLGTLNFYGGIAQSSDVYFYYLSGGYYAYGNNFDGLGIDRLSHYARLFGLGAPTGIDVAGEAAGNVPDAEWKEKTFGDVWTIGDTYNMGIGQGFLAVTPIQMVRVVAAVANGGKLLTPRVVREVRDADQHVVVANDPVYTQIPIDAENFAHVREGMRQAVSWGSAKNGKVPGVEIGGKTGTAEFGERFADGSYETHAWFSGFGPFEDPQIAVTVFLERGVGAIDAAPLASKIMDYYFHRPQPQRVENGGQPIGQQP